MGGKATGVIRPNAQPEQKRDRPPVTDNTHPAPRRLLAKPLLALGTNPLQEK